MMLTNWGRLCDLDQKNFCIVRHFTVNAKFIGLSKSAKLGLNRLKMRSIGSGIYTSVTLLTPLHRRLHQPYLIIRILITQEFLDGLQ